MGKSKLSLNNTLSYLIGNYRYKLYYSSYKYLIRKHILEQIEFRIKIMNRECYEKGECVLCGCQTTALQMANKSCDGNCYPSMMYSSMWWQFKRGGKLILENNLSWEISKYAKNILTRKKLLENKIKTYILK